VNLLKTIVIIADAFIVTFGLREGGRMALRGARQLVRALFTRESDLSRARMESCRHCHIYNRELGTCGTPGETYQETVVVKTIEFKRTKPLGCWCYLPIANRLPNKPCWARFNKLSFGWPDELMPKD
jgi:hypothetical protein